MAEALAEHDLGAVIRIFRQRTGASQSDISVLVGIPQPHISVLEHGKRQVISFDLLQRFADGLGIPPKLLGLADENSPGPAYRIAGTTGVNYRKDEASSTVTESHQQWLRVRHALNRRRAELTHIVSEIYPSSHRLGATCILMPAQWRLQMPVDLAFVDLVWDEEAPAPVITGQESETRPLRPLVSPGKRYTRYHRAMRDLDRPRLFENRLCYRLLNVRSRSAEDQRVALVLTMGNMCYFDMIDVGEALAHEAALAAIDARGKVRPEYVAWERLPFRRLARDPFDRSYSAGADGGW